MTRCGGTRVCWNYNGGAFVEVDAEAVTHSRAMVPCMLVRPQASDEARFILDGRVQTLSTEHPCERTLDPPIAGGVVHSARLKARLGDSKVCPDRSSRLVSSERSSEVSRHLAELRHRCGPVATCHLMCSPVRDVDMPGHSGRGGDLSSRQKFAFISLSCTIGKSTDLSTCCSD